MIFIDELLQCLLNFLFKLTGLHNKVPVHPESNSYELHLLADHRNYNLLLVAAEIGNTFIVNFMLDSRLSTEAHDTNASTLAWNGRHFETLCELLKSNHTFPKSFVIDECPDKVKYFHQVSFNLNEAMILGNTEKVLEILSSNPEMKYFYNLHNESILAFALKNKLFDIYRLLISKDFKFGPHEKFSEIKKSMKTNDKEELREIHYKESKSLPDNHMHVLLSNSRLGHDTTETERKFKIIQKAFEILNENPFIQVILMVVAASRNFRIIFDFNCDSVEIVDPIASETSKGSFYLTGRIYVGAKKLLDDKAKYEALGTLAHELCHHAVNLVYKNFALPYYSHDNQTEANFEEISFICKENCGKEDIIDFVYQCYSGIIQHAELIVRPAHLIMLYWKNPQEFEKIRNSFIKLFNDFEDRVIPDMKKALPKIETKADREVQTKNRKIRNLQLISIFGGFLFILLLISGFFITRSIFFKPTFKFSTLSNSDKLKVMSAPINYKNVSLEFQNLFANSSNAYEMLSSDHISHMLYSKESLNLDTTSSLYLRNFINHNWKNLPEMISKKILSSNFKFQNETVKYSNFSLSVMESLNPQQIVDILDNKILTVQTMPTYDIRFHIERKFFDYNMYEIYYLFLKNVSNGRAQRGCSFTIKNTNKTFEEFYQNYKNQDDKSRFDILYNIRFTDSFTNCVHYGSKFKGVIKNKVVDRISNHKSLLLDYNQILKEATNEKLIIIASAEKEEMLITFQKFTILFKKRFPNFWVSLIDSKNLNNLNISLSDMQNPIVFFENYFKLNLKDRKSVV